MKRTSQRVDLGTASRQTKGGTGPGFDSKNQLALAGLADD